jgi:hypothetical protein
MTPETSEQNSMEINDVLCSILGQKAAIPLIVFTTMCRLRADSWGEGSGMRERIVPGEPRKLRNGELQTIITELIMPRKMGWCAT